MSLPSRLLGANPSIQVSTLLSGSLTTPSAKGVFVPPTSYESIATATGTGSSGVITFSSIPATYTHLQLRYIAKGTSALGGFPTTCFFRFNGDTASNYRSHNLRGLGSTPLNGTSLETYMAEVAVPGLDGWGSERFGVGIIDILDYTNTNKFKTVRSFNGAENNGSGGVYLSSSNWRSTSAINEITITGDATYTTNFATSSSFALYGIKG